MQVVEVEDESVLPSEDDPKSSEIKTDNEILAMLDRMEKLEMEAEGKSREVEEQGLFTDPILKIHKIPGKKHEKEGSDIMIRFAKSSHQNLVVLSRCCKRTKSC